MKSITHWVGAFALALFVAAPATAQINPNVTGLPAAAPTTGNEIIPCFQGGQRKACLASQLGGASASALAMNQVAVAPSDSRGAQYAASLGNPETQRVSSPLSYAMALSDQRLTLVYLGGVSANTVAQTVAANSPDPRYTGQNNLEAYLSTSAGIGYYPPMWANDIGQLVPKETTWANTQAMLDRDAAKGRYIIFTLEIGAPAFTPTQVGMVHWLNARARQWAAGKPNVSIIDAPSVIWDPSNTSTTAIVHKAGYTDGGPHFFAPAAHAAGQLTADVIKVISPIQPKLARAASEIWANGGVQMNQSPTGMVTVAQPANAGGITYTSAMPAGLTVLRGLNNANGTGAATATVSLIDDPSGIGKALKVDATWTQSGEYIQLDFAWSPAVLTGLSAGDRVFSGAKVKVAAGSVNSVAPWAYQRLRVDGVDLEANGLRNDPSLTPVNAGADYTSAYDYELRTGSITVPAFTSITQALQRIRLHSAGAGSQSVIFSQISGWREVPFTAQ